MENISKIRNQYQKFQLNEDEISPDPLLQFRVWLNEAIRLPEPEPTAMTLSTVNNKGRPSSRILLLKDLNDNGFLFFTNYNSRKAAEISENQYGSLLFFWPLMERQVRVEGKVSKISESASAEYFMSRPYESQLAAWASPQSHSIENRAWLENRYIEAKNLFENSEMIKPANWGGYCLVPDYFEFWQGGENRLHDRIQYALTNGCWQRNRLAP